MTEIHTWWPLVVFIFSAGLGWGVHQVTLTMLTRQLAKLEQRVDQMDKLIDHQASQLERIEAKLDMLIRSCPAINCPTKEST